MRNVSDGFTIILADMTSRGARKLHSICEKSIQNWPELSGGRCNNPKNLTGRRLLLQSLSQLAVARFEFLE
jgi:hypothetical protein